MIFLYTFLTCIASCAFVFVCEYIKRGRSKESWLALPLSFFEGCGLALMVITLAGMAAMLKQAGVLPLVQG